MQLNGRVDGDDALMTALCGKGACHWTVDVLEPPKRSILSIAFDQAVPPPKNAYLPVLSIIQTVHLEPPKS